MSKRTSECKSNCSATNPTVKDYHLSLLPDEVQEKLKKLDLECARLRKCSYCGDIWIEKIDYVGNSPLSRVIKVGIDNQVGGEGMIWKILE